MITPINILTQNSTSAQKLYSVLNIVESDGMFALFPFARIWGPNTNYWSGLKTQITKSENQPKIYGLSPLCLGLTNPCLMSIDKETWPTSAPRLSTVLTGCPDRTLLIWVIATTTKICASHGGSLNRVTPKPSKPPLRLPTHWAYYDTRYVRHPMVMPRL